MEILRVLNNNLVLARDGTGREVILTGRGLGFGTRAGNPVDLAKVVRTFVPSDGRDPDHLAELLAGIPPEIIQVVSESLAEVGLDAESTQSPTLVIALADHLNFAAHRATQGQGIEYPLRAEVANLYPDELDRAVRLLAAVNRRSPVALPDAEAVALALHLVNAGLATGDLSFTYRMTGVIQQLIEVIESSYDIALPSNSISLGRLVTHLRYLFVRIHEHAQLDEPATGIGASIRRAYPRATDCAERLAALVELRMGAALTEDEVSYLALHVARCAESR